MSDKNNLLEEGQLESEEGAYTLVTEGPIEAGLTTGCSLVWVGHWTWIALIHFTDPAAQVALTLLILCLHVFTPRLISGRLAQHRKISYRDIVFLSKLVTLRHKAPNKVDEVFDFNYDTILVYYYEIFSTSWISVWGVGNNGQLNPIVRKNMVFNFSAVDAIAKYHDIEMISYVLIDEPLVLDWVQYPNHAKLRYNPVMMFLYTSSLLILLTLVLHSIAISIPNLDAIVNMSTFNGFLWNVLQLFILFTLSIYSFRYVIRHDYFFPLLWTGLTGEQFSFLPNQIIVRHRWKKEEVLSFDTDLPMEVHYNNLHNGKFIFEIGGEANRAKITLRPLHQSILYHAAAYYKAKIYIDGEEVENKKTEEEE
jgi:hypothetical protein